MACFAGIVRLDGRDIGTREEERLIAIIGRRAGARPRARRAGGAVFAQSEPHPETASSCLFAADARLENAAELAATVGLPARGSDAALMLRAFELSGDAGVARLLGAFAFAHWRAETRCLTLARDCLGQKPLFFHRGDGFVAFASMLPDLMALPEIPRAIDETLIASFLALDHRETRRTPYLGIDRVPSRTLIEMTPAGIRVRRYWEPNPYAPPPPGNRRDWVDGARARLDRAVARCVSDIDRVAVLTSGGLDSSAVAATLARQGRATHCYTGVAGTSDVPISVGRYLDEKPKVEALVRMYPTLTAHYVCPDAVEAAGPRANEQFLRYGLPMRGGAGTGWFPMIDRCIIQDGFTCALTGGMGNHVLSWDGSFSLGARAREGHLATMLREAAAIAGHQRTSLLRILGRELVLRNSPRGVRRLISRLRGRDPDDVRRHTLLRREAIEALGLPERWRRNGFDPWYTLSGDSVAWRAHHIFDQNQLGRDRAAMREGAGETAWRDPFADRELIEFCLAVPEWLYRQNGMPRAFARTVLADRLPHEILNETRRGEQRTNWFAALGTLKAEFSAEADRIEASPLAERLIDVPRLRHLIATWPDDRASAHARMLDYRLALPRAVHVGQFIRWVEGGNG